MSKLQMVTICLLLLVNGFLAGGTYMQLAVEEEIPALFKAGDRTVMILGYDVYEVSLLPEEEGHSLVTNRLAEMMADLRSLDEMED